jgi:hypothetical protein
MPNVTIETRIVSPTERGVPIRPLGSGAECVGGGGTEESVISPVWHHQTNDAPLEGREAAHIGTYGRPDRGVQHHPNHRVTHTQPVMGARCATS